MHATEGGLTAGARVWWSSGLDDGGSGRLWGWRHHWLRSRTGVGGEQVTAGSRHGKGVEEAGRMLTAGNEINRRCMASPPPPLFKRSLDN